ncbi:MAG TPA: DegV family protein, partial [Lachnospiraceae bacterium]|nr:DegV family protein [Lachnospiraceae bacterium]
MIRIITDSTSDISMEKAKELNVDVMALTVSFGEQSYKSGIDITNAEFYKRLVSSSELPKTAQVNPYEFEEKYKEYLDAGDEIISIHISKELSGTYQSAVIAKEALDSDKIAVLDSLNVTSALGLLVIIAAKMRDEGASMQEITDALHSYIPRLRLFVVLDTLDYVRKGGRISPTIAFI